MYNKYLYFLNNKTAIPYLLKCQAKKHQSIYFFPIPGTDFQPGWTRIISGSYDNTIKLWNEKPKSEYHIKINGFEKNS